MTASSATSPSAPVVPPRLRRALGGVWRLTWPQVFAPGRWPLMLLLLSLFGLLSWLATRGGSTHDFLEWATGFHLQVLIPVGAFLSGAGAIRDDMKSTSVDYVLARPVPRVALVAFRYLSHLACAQALGLVAFAVLIGTAVHRGVPDLPAVLPDLLLAQVLGVAAFLALGFACGALTARYLVVGLVYGGVIEIGLGQIPIQLNRLSLLHHLRAIVQPVAPGIAGPPADTAPWAAGALLLLISAVLLAGAAVLFAVREYAGAGAKEA